MLFYVKAELTLSQNSVLEESLEMKNYIVKNLVGSQNFSF